jgi:hypothetical protein
MDSQLSVFSDDVVELLSDADRYWWLVREAVSGQTGYVPSEIIESEAEHEAKLNRQRNMEATRLRESDLGTNVPWRESSAKEKEEEEAPWSASGFMRKGRLDSAPESRHKKTVSFSETRPVEHHFDVEESSSSVEGDELAAPMEELHVTEPGYYDRNVDPMVDEILQREFGKPDMNARTRKVEEFHSIPPSIEPNSAVLMSKSKIREQSKKGKGLGMISKLWKPKQNEFELRDEQLLRIYAGNFTSVQGYKTLLVEEGASMAEVADKACEKFGVVGDGFDYMLSLVHCDSFEILHVTANYSLGMVIELAKRATLLEGEYSAITSHSLARLSRKLRKQQAKMIRNIQNQHNQHNMSSPAGSMSLIEELVRSRESDFVTHYKFVLNRWLEGPGPTIPFYTSVQMGGVGNGSFSILTDAQRRPKSPRSPMSPRPQLLVQQQDDVSVQGNVKMLVNTSMSVVELMRAAIVALDVSAVPGIRYELYLANRLNPTTNHIYLTKDMIVADMLHLRPTLDPSGLNLILQAVVDSHGNQ